MALGDEDTTTEILSTPGKTLSSLLPATDFGKNFNAKLADPVRQQVDVRRLDGLFDEIVEGIADPRVYLKMDTQGFDLPTFRGAGDRVDEILGMQSEVALRAALRRDATRSPSSSWSTSPAASRSPGCSWCRATSPRCGSSSST